MARALGGPGDDSLSISGDDSIARGRAGNDTITVGDGTGIDLFGGPGFDALFFDLPNSSLRGGATVDLAAGTASRGSGATALTATLNSIERVEGTAFDDTFRGSGHDEALTGGGGSDSLFGFGGIDDLAAGFDGADDRLFGGDGDDGLLLGQGADAGEVLSGVDVAFGGDGDDTFTLRGGQAARAHGQAGADTFFWREDRGRTVACDFEDGVDKLQLNRGDVQDFLDRAEQVGQNVVVDLIGLPAFGSAHRIFVLHDFTLANLGQDDFIV